MTIEITEGAVPAALARVGDEIAREAPVATGALFVHVSSFDPATGLVRTAASAGPRLGSAIVGRRWVLPGWSVDDLVDFADGTWSIQSAPGRGTTLRASLPLGDG
jgi:hypothetical protein